MSRRPPGRSGDDLGGNAGPASGAESDAAPKSAEAELEGLRANDQTYDALVRNMTWSFESKGLAVRKPAMGEDPSLAVDGMLPTLAAESERATFVLEFATAKVLRHPHLLVRLRALQKIAGARRWLVVPSDEWAEARALVASRRLKWQVIVGDR